MKVKIKRNRHEELLGSHNFSHDLLRNVGLIGLGKEPVLLEGIPIPPGSERMQMEIRGMYIRVDFFGKKLGQEA